MLLYSTQIKIGWQAPDFNLANARGGNYHLYSQNPKKGILIFFTCNHCPYAKAAWPILIDLYNVYKKKGIEFVAINPNDENDYSEDSFAIPFPYLRDETQDIAKAYQAQCTPDVYLFDSDKKLFYHGRVNDNWKDNNHVTRNDLDEALRRLFIGDRPPVEQFPSMGCSIKWKK